MKPRNLNVACFGLLKLTRTSEIGRKTGEAGLVVSAVEVPGFCGCVTQGRQGSGGALKV